MGRPAAKRQNVTSNIKHLSLPAALLPAVCCLLPAARYPPPAARRPLPGPGGKGAESHKMALFCDTAFLDGIRVVYHVGKLRL